MGLKAFFNKKWIRILGNKYVLILLVFSVWMLFFDSNSWLVHQELNQELKELQNNAKYYQQEIKHDKTVMEQLSDSFELEKYAREKYYMKRENEEIFIIEYQDSLKTD